MLFNSFICLFYLMVLTNTYTIPKSIDNKDLNVYGNINNIGVKEDIRHDRYKHKYRREEKATTRAVQTKHTEVTTKLTTKLTTESIKLKTTEKLKPTRKTKRLRGFWRKIQSKIKNRKEKTSVLNDVARKRRIIPPHKRYQMHGPSKYDSNFISSLATLDLNRKYKSADERGYTKAKKIAIDKIKRGIGDIEDLIAVEELVSATPKIDKEKRSATDNEIDITPFSEKTVRNFELSNYRTYTPESSTNHATILTTLSTKIANLKSKYGIDKYKTPTLPMTEEYNKKIYSLAPKTSKNTDSNNYPGTAQIESLLNEIKNKAIQMIAEQNPEVTDIITNTVTEATFEADPILTHLELGSPGYALSTFVFMNDINLSNLNEKRDSANLDLVNVTVSQKPAHIIEPRSIKEDAYTIAQSVEDVLQKEIKKVYKKVKNKVSKDFKNEVHKTTEKATKITHRITHTKAPARPITKPMMVPKIKSHKPTTSRKSRNTSTKTTELNTDFTTKETPPTYDDYVLLTLYEQILAKSHEDNLMKMLTSPSVINNLRRNLKQSKRDVKNDQLNQESKLYDEDGVPEESILYGESNGEDNENDFSSSSTENVHSSTEENTEDTSFEGLSSKISYNDYVNGYKHYLKFQREQGDQKFSNQIRYQAHRHHKVDDIGKFILNKIPQLPQRIKRKFFEETDADDVDISTKSDDSWFKKHFYLFIDNGPPKKFHTSQTVELKSPITEAGTNTRVTEKQRYAMDNYEMFDTLSNAREVNNEEKQRKLTLEDLSNTLEDFKIKYSSPTTPYDNTLSSSTTTVPFKGFDPQSIMEKLFGGKGRRSPKHHFKKEKNDKDFGYEFDLDRFKREVEKIVDKELVNKKHTPTMETFTQDTKTQQKRFDKSINYGCVDINLIQQPTEIIQIRDTRKENRIKKFFNKFRLFKKKETKKTKREFQYRPQRFNPFKKLKDLFRGEAESKPFTTNHLSDYDIMTSHIDTFKPVKYNQAPNLDEIRKLIPNITDTPVRPKSSTKPRKFKTKVNWDKKYKVHTSKVTSPWTVNAKIYPISSPSSSKKSHKKTTMSAITSPATPYMNLVDHKYDDIINVKIKTIESRVENDHRDSSELVKYETETFTPQTIEDIKNEISNIEKKISTSPTETPAAVLNNDNNDFSIDDKEFDDDKITDFHSHNDITTPESIDINPVIEMPQVYESIESDFVNIFKEPIDVKKYNDKRWNKELNDYLTPKVRDKWSGRVSEPYRYKPYPDYFNDLIVWHKDILETDTFPKPTWQNILNKILNSSESTTHSLKDMQMELVQIKDFLHTDNNVKKVDNNVKDLMFKINNLANKKEEIESPIEVTKEGSSSTAIDIISDIESIYKKSTTAKPDDKYDVRKLLYEYKDNLYNRNKPEEAPSQVYLDTTLLAYDDGPNLLKEEFDNRKLYRNSLHSSELYRNVGVAQITTKINTPPIQYFNTPLPMRRNDFEKFLKENKIDVQSVTSPMLDLPILNATSYKSSKFNAKLHTSKITVKPENTQTNIIHEKFMKMTTKHKINKAKDNILFRTSPKSFEEHFLNEIEDTIEKYNHNDRNNEKYKRSTVYNGIFSDPDKLKRKIKLFNRGDDKKVGNEKTTVKATEIFDLQRILNGVDRQKQDVDITILSFDSDSTEGIINKKMEEKYVTDKVDFTNPQRIEEKIENIDRIHNNLIYEDTTVMNTKNGRATSKFPMLYSNSFDNKESTFGWKAVDKNIPKRIRVNGHSFKYDIIYHVKNRKTKKSNKPGSSTYSDPTTPEDILVNNNSRGAAPYIFSSNAPEPGLEVLEKPRVVREDKFDKSTKSENEPNIATEDQLALDKVNDALTSKVEKQFQPELNKENDATSPKNEKEHQPILDKENNAVNSKIENQPTLNKENEAVASKTQKENESVLNKEKDAINVKTEKELNALNKEIDAVSAKIDKEDQPILDKDNDAISSKIEKGDQLALGKENDAVNPKLEKEEPELNKGNDAVTPKMEKDDQPTLDTGTDAETTKMGNEDQPVLTTTKATTSQTTALKANSNMQSTSTSQSSHQTTMTVKLTRPKTTQKVKDVIYIEPGAYDEQVYFEPALNPKSSTNKLKTTVKPHPKKRDVNSGVQTAKNVAALEIIVDLMRNAFNNELSPEDANVLINKGTMKPVLQQTNAIQVHIAIPYNQNEKRSIETAKVRKVFTARMSTPVDLEYQVYSFENTQFVTESLEKLSPGMYLLVDKGNATMPSGNFALKPIKKGFSISDIKIRQAETTMPITQKASTTNPPKHFGRVTLSRDFISAINNNLIKLYENITNSSHNVNTRDIDGKYNIVKQLLSKISNRHKRHITWEKVKKYFGHDRVCNCKCRENQTMCRACAASNQVMSELIFEFDNLAKYMNDHCTEIQTFFWMNPLGGKKLRDTVHKVDKSLNDYYKRVKGKCRGRTCKTFSTYLEKRDMFSNKIEKDYISYPLIKDVTTFAEDLEEALRNKMCYSEELITKGEKLVNVMKKCASVKFKEKRSNDEAKEMPVKNLYSLDKINVNIICKPESSTHNVLSTIKLNRLNNVRLFVTETANLFDYNEEVKKNKRKSFRNFFRYRKHKKSKDLSEVLGKKDRKGLTKKREVQTSEQIESPLIADSGGSFWHDYINKINNNDRINRDSNKHKFFNRSKGNKNVTSTSPSIKSKKESNQTAYAVVYDLTQNTEILYETTPEIDSLTNNLNVLLKLFGNYTDVEVIRNMTSHFAIVSDHTTLSRKHHRTKKPKTKKTKKTHHKTTKKMHTKHKSKATKTHVANTKPTTIHIPRYNATHHRNTTYKVTTKEDVKKVLSNAVTPATNTQKSSASLLNKLKMASISFMNKLDEGNYVINDTKVTNGRHVRKIKSNVTEATSEVNIYNIISDKTTKENPMILIISDDDDEEPNDVSSNKKVSLTDEDREENNYKKLLKVILKYEIDSLRDEFKRFNEKEAMDRNVDKMAADKIIKSGETPTPTTDNYDILSSLKSLELPAPSNLTTAPGRGFLGKLASKFSLKMVPGTAVHSTKPATAVHDKAAKLKSNPTTSMTTEKTHVEAANATVTSVHKSTTSSIATTSCRKSKKRNIIRKKTKSLTTKHVISNQTTSPEIKKNTETCEPKLDIRCICDVHATFQHVLNMQRILPKNILEDFVKNITCFKYKKAPKHFFIGTKNECREKYDVIHLDSEDDIKWNWIRNKRSADFERNVKDVHVLNDDYFEAFEKEKHGIYRVRRKRQIAVDASELVVGLKNLPPLRPMPHEMYVMQGDSITIECISRDPNMRSWRADESQLVWKTDRDGMLNEDNVDVDGGTITIRGVRGGNAGAYFCNRGDEVVSEAKLSVVTIPSYDVVFTQIYATAAGCDYSDLKQLGLLASTMSDNLCSCGKHCSVRIDEPACLRNKMDGSAQMRATAVLTTFPHNKIKCSVQCRRDLECSLAYLCASNAPALSSIGVILSKGDFNKSLTPTFRSTKRCIVTHTLRRKDSNGHHEYRKLSAHMDPGTVDVVVSCPAGYYLVSRQKICAACPPDTYSPAGMNCCRSCPRGMHSSPAAATCSLRARSLKRRQYQWWYSPTCGWAFTCLCVACACCACTVCALASRLFAHNSCTAPGELHRENAHVQYSAHTACKRLKESCQRRRALSPSRVILARFYRTPPSSRATDSQETKFELWKEKHIPPPLPPIDFDILNSEH